VTETQLNGATPATEPAPSHAKSNTAARTAIWTGVALGAVGTATIAFFVVRSLWKRRPADETSERIQSLIDEANRLIRTLEEKKECRLRPVSHRAPSEWSSSPICWPTAKPSDDSTAWSCSSKASCRANVPSSG
jgi:hypothetical protein